MTHKHSRRPHCSFSSTFSMCCQLPASLLFIRLFAKRYYCHCYYRIWPMSEVTIIKPGKDIDWISDSSDRLHIRAMWLYLKCFMENVRYNKGHNFKFQEDLFVSFISGKCDSVHPKRGNAHSQGWWQKRSVTSLLSSGNWHNSVPRLKVFFPLVRRIS